MADEFKPEFDALDQEVRREVLALARVLQELGPQLGRPRVDTLNGSRHANTGEWPSPLILGVRRFYLWPATNRVGAKSVFTANWYGRPTSGFTPILPESERGRNHARKCE